MLIGIAKMAAQSELLEAKRVVDYRELEVRSYISRCTSAFMPFQWTINPYRGCEIGCKYCYARYTHEFMELDPDIGFETQIFVKQWNPVEFRRELGRIPLGDLQRFMAKAKAEGRAVRGIADHEFIHSIYFRDHSGYVIELTVKEPEHDAAMDPTRNNAARILQDWQAHKVHA